MTIERRLIFGLDDIKAITFECSTCQCRASVVSDMLDSIPESPCGHEWKKTGKVDGQMNKYSPKLLLIAISGMKKLEHDPGFKILLEYEEPKS